MESKIYQQIAESYLNNQLVILQNLSAKIEFPFISEFASTTENFLKEKFRSISTKKDLLSFQNIVDTLDEINGIFLRTTDKSSYWVMPLIKEFYSQLNIDASQREILIVNDYKVSYSDGGYGVIVDLFNNKNISKLKFPKTQQIDVFFLPRQSNFSLSSIAILAHEVGHVFFSSKKDIQKDIVDEILRQLIADNKTIDLFNDPLSKIRRTNVSSHIEEFICDNIGHFLLGPIFDFAAVKVLGIIEDDELTYSQGSHPPVFKRLYNCKQKFGSFLKTLEKRDIFYTSVDKINTRFFDNIYLIPPIGDDLGSEEKYFLELSNSVAEKITSKYLKTASLHKAEEYRSAFFKCFDNLNKLVPLSETIASEKVEAIKPWELLTSSIIYFSGNAFESENEFYKNSPIEPDIKREQLKKILISFNKYAINLFSFFNKVKTDFPENPITRNTVWNLRNRGQKADPFIVVPTIDFERQYSSNAVDLRLGNTFITSKLTEFTHIPTNPSDTNPLNNKNIEYFFEKHFIPFNKCFTLHPHNFVLAVTLEYICIPIDYYALVLGRSTWGRLGLNIATATAVGPGFKGCITLELRNLSEVPITLNVGTRICQICLIKNPEERGATPYYLSNNKYICPTEVEYPKINLDPDWHLLSKFAGH